MLIFKKTLICLFSDYYFSLIFFLSLFEIKLEKN